MRALALLLALAAPSLAADSPLPAFETLRGLAGMDGAVVQIGRYSNCPFASPNDSFPDDDALQDCLDLGGTITLLPGKPGYILRKGLRVRRPNTAITSMRAPEKALLVADPNLNGAMLKVVGEETSGLRLDHLVFDGNRDLRRISCAGYRDYGSNISISGQRDVKVLYVESLRAACGSALEIYAEDYEVAYSLIKDAGYDRANQLGPEPWADGITAGLCVNGKVHDNIVENATDLGIVSGGGRGCEIKNNVIRQTGSHAFGGLAVHNFHWEDLADHPEWDQKGSVYSGNVIESAPGLLDYGISAGIHSWFAQAMTDGGSIINNRVSGAVVNIVVEGYRNGAILENVFGPTGGKFHAQSLVRCDYSGQIAAGHFEKVQLPEKYDEVTFHDGSCQIIRVEPPRRRPPGTSESQTLMPPGFDNGAPGHAPAQRRFPPRR